MRIGLDDAGDQASDSIDQDEGRQLATGQDVITDAHLAIRQDPGSLVDPLVSAAHQRDMRQFTQTLRFLLRERTSLRRGQNHRRRPSAFHLDRAKRPQDRLRTHHHPRSPAVRCVVDHPVAPDAVLAQVVEGHRQDSALHRAADHRGPQRRLEELGEEGHDLDLKERAGRLVGHQTSSVS